jgi:hypothetical protein
MRLHTNLNQYFNLLTTFRKSAIQYKNFFIYTRHETVLKQTNFGNQILTEARETINRGQVLYRQKQLYSELQTRPLVREAATK